MFNQMIFFSVFISMFGLLNCAARDIPRKKNDEKHLVILVLRSPGRDIEKIENFFPCADELGPIPVGVYDPDDIIAEGCSPEIFFRTRILPNSEDAMKISWLNNLFDSSQGQKIGQEIRDRMLLDICSDRRSSTALIEVLLERGADPCVGAKSSVDRILDRLYEKGPDAELVSKQLLLLVTYVCKYPQFFQQENEVFSDAHQRYLQRLNLRMDSKELLKEKFNDKQFKAAYGSDLVVWEEICEMLGQVSFRD